MLLRHVVEAARELVGARHAALGVPDRAGGLAEFVHTGMPAATVVGADPVDGANGGPRRVLRPFPARPRPARVGP